MVFPPSLKKQQMLIALAVGLFALFALWLRLVPLLAIGHSDLIRMVAMDDPFYNLRQTESLLANSLQYGWFDAMTHYPFGTSIYWGPVFPTIIALFCLVTGSATRPEIIGTALLVTPLIAAATVVLMYYVGRAFGDWKTGVLASGFSAIIAGQFFTISMYGYIDHHIAEVFFSTLFCLLYTGAVLSAKDADIDLREVKTWRKTAILAGLAGIGYLLGLFTMPTMILFALIVGLFTLVQFVVDVFRNRTSEYLVIINGTVFLVAIAGLLLFGLKDPGMGLSTYSIGHIYAYLALIAGTGVLYALTHLLKGKNPWYFPATLVGCACIVLAFLSLLLPDVFSMFSNAVVQFFGQQAVTETVEEAMGWSLNKAWLTYHYGLILFAGGVLVMLYNNWIDEHPHQVFALVWSLVMLISTWQHIRYEYYLAINIALMAAVCVAFVVGKGIPALSPLMQRAGSGHSPAVSTGNEKEKAGKGKKRSSRGSEKRATARSGTDTVLIGLVLATALIAALFCYYSVSTNYSVVSARGDNLIPDWRESLEWLGNNTPDTGVDYLKIYDPKTFAYPEQSYGVMTWWDYGHMITYIAKRIPNANPFQQGVTGPDGAAAFFVTTSESDASRILDNLNTRYVITDSLMDTGKFPAMSTWYNSSVKESPYMEYLFLPGTEGSGRVEARLFYTPLYYHTMVSRLHNLDGSMVQPARILYIEYTDPGITGLSLPLIVNAEEMDTANATERARIFNSQARPGYHAKLISVSLLSPADTVPALQHYRLVHESSTNSLASDTADLKFVKTFEYVKGAHIRGEGVIAIPLITNTGRTFTYYQESTDGEFIVPYSTTDNRYDVRATGKYRIIATGQEFDVPESAVIEGLTIN